MTSTQTTGMTFTNVTAAALDAEKSIENGDRHSDIGVGMKCSDLRFRNPIERLGNEWYICDEYCYHSLIYELPTS